MEDPSGVHRHDRIEGGVHDRPVVCLARTQRSLGAHPRGDIEEGADHPCGATGSIVHHLELPLHRALLAVGAQQAVCERLVGRSSRDPLLDASAVGGVNQGQESL